MGIRKGNILIEHTVLRDAAGPKAIQRKIQEKIIFPYAYDEEGRIVRFTETQFRMNYPGAYQYLQQNYEKLTRRKADFSVKWFEYGGSQLLVHLNQPKLLLSSFITQQPCIYIIDQDTVPYAGICVVAKQGYTIEQAYAVLNSAAFMDYVRRIGVCTNGVSYRIMDAIVEENFKVETLSLVDNLDKIILIWKQLLEDKNISITVLPDSLEANTIPIKIAMVGSIPNRSFYFTKGL